MRTKRLLRLFSLLLCAAMLFSISGCGNSKANTKVEVTRVMLYDESVPDNDTTATKGFRVGFGRTEILPEDSVPLCGYGDSLNRMSTGFLDVLYVSCIAVTDEDDKTLLLITADLTTTKDIVTENARKYANETYGVDEEYLHFTSTHTHSAPDIAQTNRSTITYLGKLYNRVHEAIDIAMADRKTAEIYAGETKTKGMNYDRHYWRSDGTAMSDNYGIFSTAPIVSHIDDPDETMRIIKFVRKTSEGKKAKDVLLINWQVHPHLSGNGQLTDSSSDLLGPFIRKVEKETGCYAAYYQGCAGNMNEKSNLGNEENNAKDGYVGHGEKLATYVIDAYNKLDKYETGKVVSIEKPFTGEASHLEEEKLAGAREIVAEYAKVHNTSVLSGLFEKYQIQSIFHARAIIRHSQTGDTYTMPVSAFAIGDIGFTSASCELFCQLGMYIRENSPYKFTVTLAYTDQHHGYMPTAQYYDAGCYEVNITNFAKGSGEKCAEQLVEMLKEIHG